MLLAWTVSEGTDTAGNKTTQLVVLLTDWQTKRNGGKSATLYKLRVFY